MAFNIDKFSLISSGYSGFTPRIWAYETEDDFSTVVEPLSGNPDYFEDAKSQLIEGDLITVRFLQPFNFTMVGTLKVDFIEPNGPIIVVSLNSPWTFNVLIPDVSTAQSVYVSMPLSLQLIAYGAMLSGPLLTANATLTLKSFPLSAAIAGSELTLFTGLVAGAAFNVFIPPDPSTVINSSQGVEVITDGASTGSVSANVTLIGL